MKADKYLYLALLTLALLGCSRYGNDLQYVKYGQIGVHITDAPFPHDMISEAIVSIEKIEARHKGSEGTGNDVVVLFEGHQDINLLDLTNGLTHYMGEVEVPAGAYDLIRIFIGKAAIQLVDGKTYELKTPSAAQSGVKAFIKPEIEVVEDLVTDVLLDFDISKSFVLKGNVDTPAGIKGFNFKPVVRVSNLNETGTLSGQVKTINGIDPLEMEGVQIGVMVSDTLHTTTFTDTNGAYMVLGLHEGSYRVLAEKTGFLTSSEDRVTITPGEVTEQDFELLPE